jgi:glycerate 2-kinase
MPCLVAAPDKFRGSASATEITRAIAEGAEASGWTVDRLPLSDGGEGLLDALATPGTELRRSEVTGPDGRTVCAEWQLTGDRAVVEMAQASGLTLVGGASGNHPVDATTRGTGELIVAAARAVGSGGTVVVGLGGSATTDGGVAALEAVQDAGGIADITLLGACDVTTLFVDAAERFGPQKGAGPTEIRVLTDRLVSLADRYLAEYGVDVRQVRGSGAAGGLGGAILAMGGRLRSGYALVSELVALRSRLAGADLVVTGEGRLDGPSFEGKVVGGVVEDSAAVAVPVLAIVGQATDDAAALAKEKGADLVVLSERFGLARAMRDASACVEEVVRDRLSSRSTR